MANNSNPQDNLDYIYDLLSPYLDGEVTEEERVLVEQALAASPEVQQELDSLRQTITMIQALPQVSAPRPFTLSQADIQPAAPAPKKSFWRLPGWGGSLALVATTLVCVLVAGAIFLGRQQSDQSPAAEIAQMQQAEAPAADEAAPQEETEAAVESRVEGQQETEEAAEEPLTEAEQEAAAEPAEAETFAEEKAGESAKESAGEAAEQDDQDTTGSGAADQITGAVQATTLPLATPMPPPSPSPSPAQPLAAAEAAEEEAQPAAPPPASETTLEAGADTEAAGQAQTPAPQPEENLYRDANARLVDIQNQRLQVRPGLITIEGIIDAPPGTTLQASLLRNEQLFNEWADPATLQSIVQQNGRFAFAIQADPNRTDTDLFALEPAGYQITIFAPAADPPIIANVFFDTFRPIQTSEPETASPTPAPTTTPSPAPTTEPSPTPIATAVPAIQPTATLQPVQPAAQSSLPGFIATGILILVVVIVIIAGVIIWFNMSRKS